MIETITFVAFMAAILLTLAPIDILLQRARSPRRPATRTSRWYRNRGAS
jgi:hypothetical protein